VRDKPTSTGDFTPDSTSADSVEPPFSDPTQVKAPAPKLVKHGTQSNPNATTPPKTPQTPKSAEKKPASNTSGVEKVQNRLHGRTEDRFDGVTPTARPKTAGDFARESPTMDASQTAVMPAVKDAPKDATPMVELSAGGVRQARLKLVRVEPWSVAKVAFALSVALAVVAVVAVTILWLVLSFAGVWDQINSSVTTVLSDNSGTFDITEYLGFGRLVGLTIVLSALNTVVMTSIAVIGSHLYNLAVQLLGGIDVTLSEDN